MSFAKEWVEALARVWREKDIESAVELFRSCTNYRESPFEPNYAAEPDGVRKLWQEVIYQSDIDVQTELRLADDENAVAVYHADYHMNGVEHCSSGVWIMKFDRGDCVSFEQWFMSDDNAP